MAQIYRLIPFESYDFNSGICILILTNVWLNGVFPSNCKATVSASGASASRPEHSQSVLAEEAGVSRRTISRTENGEGVSLDTFVRVARALGLVEQLQSLFQLPEIRPVDRVREQAPRKNASSSRSKTKDTETPWEWDD